MAYCFVSLGCGGGGEAGGGEDAAEVGGEVAVEEGGVGFFGQELELGCVGPVIGVVLLPSSSAAVKRVRR